MTETNNYLHDINLQLTRLNDRVKVVLYIGIPLILLLPYFLTKFSILDFTETGSIGDTIGGITAPVIGLIFAFIIYFSFIAQIKANQIQIKAIQDTRNRNEAQELNNEVEKKLQQIENQFIEINDIWLEMLNGFENRNKHIPYHDYHFISLILEKGKISILNSFFFKINIFMEDLKKYKHVHSELKKRKIISQFSVLIAMSCDDLFQRLIKGIKEKNDRSDLEYTNGILSTIMEVANKLKEEDYYFRDQNRILKVIEDSIMSV